MAKGIDGNRSEFFKVENGQPVSTSMSHPPGRETTVST